MEQWGGVNAQDTYEEVYSRTTWSETDITDWGGNASLGIDATYGLGFNVISGNSAEKTFTIAENSKIKYEVSWVVGNSVAYDNNFAYIQFGDNIRLSWANKYYTYLDTDGKSSKTTQNPTILKSILFYHRILPTIPCETQFHSIELLFRNPSTLHFTNSSFNKS